MPLLNYNSASSEETIFHAQRIIDFYAKSLKEKGCLSHIPATLYAEADHHVDKIEAIKSAIDSSNSVSTTSSLDKYKNDPIRAAIRRSAGRDCLDCRPTIPLIRFNGMKGQAYFDAKDFLNKMKSLKGGSFSKALPSLAFLFSSFCIPDLIKLLSLLLASLIRFTFSLDISKFSFMKLLMAILAKLLGNLLKFASASIKVSLSSIMCVLDALVQLNDSLVPQQEFNLGMSLTNNGVEISDKTSQQRANAIAERDNANRQLDERSNTTIFLGTEIKSESIDVENFKFVENLRKGLSRKLPEQKDVDNIKTTIEEVQETINKALIDMESAIFEIFQIGQVIQCESERSTRKASDSIESIMKWIQLINLIRSVIKKKTRVIARHVIASPSYEFYDNIQFTTEDVAEVVGEAVGKLGVVYSTEPGNTGVLLIDNNDNFTDKPLSLYSCNLNEFVESSHLDNIIEDAKTFAENNLVGQGNPPSYFTNDYIPVGNEEFIPFNINEDDILKQIADILKFLNIKNPYEEQPSQDVYQNKISSTLQISSKIDTVLGNIGKIKI